MSTRKSKFKLGLVVNPYAGIGGAMALKGSDGAEIREKALSMGAKKLANHKTGLALKEVVANVGDVEVYTAAGEMGASVARELGFSVNVVYSPDAAQTEATDTEATVKALTENQVDMILFAGGDGTARNVCASADGKIPVLGIPAGCKIHSGVYAITPRSAGKVVDMLVRGELVSLQEAEVRDIDETAFRDGKVLSRHFGEMRVPAELQYVQAVKMGGKESDELVLADIGAQVIDNMVDNPDTLYVMGSGSTVDSVMQELGLENTLLGVDVVQDQQLLASDVTAPQLLALIKGRAAKLVITLIGGQGHVFGRGNQQLTPEVIRQIGRDNIIVVATKAKLHALEGKPLISDSGDSQLDAELSGPIEVTTGYRDFVLYPLSGG